MADLCDVGTGERFKAWCHISLLCLSTTFALYNLWSWHARRERHLVVNAALYGGLGVWEISQIHRHLELTAAPTP